MQNFSLAVLAVFLCSLRAFADPSTISQNGTGQGLFSRDKQWTPEVDLTPPSPPVGFADRFPPRPDGVGNRTFHTNQFKFFDELGFTVGSPAVDSAPVFLFSRARGYLDPCYPESAIIIGSDPPQPNPGTGSNKGVPSANPGQWCTGPGRYHGPYTQGAPFPVYVSATFCGFEWRINYDLYYVHDGAMSQGHKHDWEGVTIVFKMVQSDSDWWYRDSIIMNKQSWRDHYTWGDIETVDVYSDDPTDFTKTDLKSNFLGNYKNHPKVYIGFYSHSAFRLSCNYCRKIMRVAFKEKTANGEYRHHHWWRLPRAEDFHLWSEIDPDWDYGHAVSTPPRNREDVCGF